MDCEHSQPSRYQESAQDHVNDTGFDEDHVKEEGLDEQRLDGEKGVFSQLCPGQKKGPDDPKDEAWDLHAKEMASKCFWSSLRQ